MRALKTLVIGMGVLIVAGLVVLVVAAVDRTGGGKSSDAAFSPASISLPAGSEIVETRVGDGRIVLRLKLADGDARLVVIDAATGRLTGTVDLEHR